MHGSPGFLIGIRDLCGLSTFWLRVGASAFAGACRREYFCDAFDDPRLHAERTQVERLPTGDPADGDRRALQPLDHVRSVSGRLVVFDVGQRVTSAGQTLANNVDQLIAAQGQLADNVQPLPTAGFG